MTCAGADLPEGWRLMPLASVGRWGSGGTPRRGVNGFYGGSIPWLKIGDLNDGEVTTAKESITEDGLRNSSAKLVEAGALLVAMYGSIGKLGISKMPCATNQAIAFCIPDERITNSDYLFWLLLHMRPELLAQGKGGAQPNISQTVLKALPVPIPPLDTQHQIVNLIQLVSASKSSASGHLERSKRDIQLLRQAVLAAACAGRLTTDWREAHPSVESAASAIDRRRLLERKRSGRKYQEPRLPSESELPSIPASWTWAALPELGDLGRGKSKHRPRNDPKLYGGRYPFIQTGDVARSGGKITGCVQTYSDIGLQQSRLWPERTVCITIAANIADSALLTFPACFPDSVVGLIADDSVALPEYVELFIRTARRDLAAFAPATAQANINLAILSELAVALPPMEEQMEIVKRAEAVYARCGAIEAALRGASSRIDRSLQAILIKAFRGEFAPDRSEEALH